MSIPSRVKSIIGITEKELVELSYEERIEKFVCADSFIHSDDYHITPLGTFQTPSIADITELVSLIGDDPGQNLGQNLRECPLEVEENIDIGVLQSTLQTLDKAMIQVASNFNCLEVPSKYTPPNYGNLVENAHTDSTQGPAACFGPLAAYLYRAHFYEGGQTGIKQINLLEGVKKYFCTPINGKLTLSGNEQPIDSVDKVVPLIKCGLHTNIPILFGREESGLNFELDEPHPLIDQVFNASINLRDYGKRVAKSDLILINRALLRASYESAYLSAIYRNRKVLYLTFVGGGVFGNPIPMILEEIVRAHKLYASKSELKRVVLCIYGEDKKIVKSINDLMK